MRPHHWRYNRDSLDTYRGHDSRHFHQVISQTNPLPTFSSTRSVGSNNYKSNNPGQSTFIFGSQRIIELEHTLNTSKSAWEAVEVELKTLKGTFDEMRDHLSKAVARCEELEVCTSNFPSNPTSNAYSNWFSPYPGSRFQKCANLIQPWRNKHIFKSNPSTPHHKSAHTFNRKSLDLNNSSAPLNDTPVDRVVMDQTKDSSGALDSTQNHPPTPLKPYNPKLDPGNPLFDWGEFIGEHLWYVKAKINLKMKASSIAQTLLLQAPTDKQIPGVNIIGGTKIWLSDVRTWQRLQFMALGHKFPNTHVRLLNFAVKLFAIVGEYEQLCIEQNTTTKHELQSFILPRFPQCESPPIKESDIHNFLIDKVGFPIEWAYEAPLLSHFRLKS